MEKDNYTKILSIFGHCFLAAGIIIAGILLFQVRETSFGEQVFEPLWIPALISVMAGIILELIFGTMGRIVKYLKIISEK